MAITATELTTGSLTTDQAAYTTASITPTANNLILLWAYAMPSTGSSGAAPTVTGNGLTWVEVLTRDHNATGRRISLMRAMGASPTTGAVTITWPNTQIGCAWSIVQYSGVDTSGTNGSGAVVQSVGNSVGAVTSITGTLAAFGSINNATVGGIAHVANEATTSGSGFTQTGTTSFATPNASLISQFAAGNDTTVDASWTTSSIGLVVAAELKAATGGGVNTTGFFQFF